ncbi:hypothetical protein GGR56DRAFT_149474 [Xylariaceae sp. FL0804]|nr:hypothetical protein GGR56DRAFT_149474 [Xylariaceae sp. FL0804]
MSFAELSKDDLSARAPERPRLVTGTVVRTGSCVDEGILGQAVAAYATKQIFETRLLTSTYAVLPSSVSLSSACSSLPQTTKPINAAICTAQAKAGDHVFLLPSTAPLEDAMTELGTRVGFQISRLPGDAAEAERVLTSSSGPKIVIAAAKSTIIQDIWRGLPRNSKLVLSDVPLMVLDPRPFSEGVTFHLCGVADRFANDPSALTHALKTSVDIFRHSFMSATSILDVGQLEDL